MTAAVSAPRTVQYVNIGLIIDMRDRSIACDGIHFVAKGNACRRPPAAKVPAA